jgi:hypothetical protein
VGSDWDDPLHALQWHWGEAYAICNPEHGVWLAIRRDNHGTLRDQTPLGLRDQIIADYTARPVSRDLPGQPTAGG